MYGHQRQQVSWVHSHSLVSRGLHVESAPAEGVLFEVWQPSRLRLQHDGTIKKGFDCFTSLDGGVQGSGRDGNDLLAHVGIFPFCKWHVGLLDNLWGRPSEDIVWATGLVVGAWKHYQKSMRCELYIFVITLELFSKKLFIIWVRTTFQAELTS